MIYQVQQRSSGLVVADGDGKIVSFDYQAGRKAPLPASVVAAITRIEEHAT